jgi:hypothetical protein
MKIVDEGIIDTYARALVKSAEHVGKFINYIELKSMIQRFLQLNPHSDPRIIDWVGVWDPTLTYEEQVANFRMHYPMYKWEERQVSEEAFEDAKRKKLKTLLDEIKELDEQSLKELIAQLEIELGQAQTEQKRASVAQDVVQKPAPITQPSPPTTPKITLRTLAGVPVLLEARTFVSAFSVEDLCNDVWVLREARGRINASVADEIWPFGDPIKDLLSFQAAIIILSQIRDRRVWERWAEAEHRRAELFMNAADDGVLEAIWTDLGIRAGRSEPQEEERTGFPYKVHVADYLRLTKEINEDKWRLDKRTVSRGWVYVTRKELIRLISEEVKARILKRLEEVKVDRVPEPIKETVERIRVSLATRFAKALPTTDNKQTSQTLP